MSGRDAVLKAFDRLFDKAASKLRIECDADSKEAAAKLFSERFASVLDVASEVITGEIPETVMQAMEEAIEELSAAQLVGYLAAIPLAHQTQQMLRTIAFRAAEQQYLEHLITQSDDRYGGN